MSKSLGGYKWVIPKSADPLKTKAVSENFKVHAAIAEILVNRGLADSKDIVKFLDSLQNRKEKVWIDMINLRLKDQTTGFLVCDLSLSIYTLKVKEI